MQPILRVDLTTGETSTLTISGEWGLEYLGGASLAARILYPHLTPDLDPLDPAAPLIFLTGPLTGTAGPAVGRFVIAARSPATGLWGESNCGGFWGPELRRAGYAGIWLSGSATEPVYLWVSDDQIEIRPAAHLWGMDTYGTQSAIQEETGKNRARVAAIGPAGEARIPFALVLCDHGRVAGRTGMGAVMGSKNLKAVAVLGKGAVPVAEPNEYAKLRQSANRALRRDTVSQVLRDMGSAGGADYFDYLGVMPKRYYQRGAFAGAWHLSGASIAENLLSGVSTCHACVIACGRVVRLSDGQDRKGPEYESMVGFGPNLWIDDPAVVTRLSELCDRYGMDTISLSNTIGLAFALFEQERIPPADTQGLELVWGDARMVERLVHATVRREGFGDYLAGGARALARRYGVPEEAVQVNGLEVAYQDPRGASGMALVYATSPRGACHNQSDYFLVDIGQVETSLGLDYFDRHAGAEKAANVARHQDWRTVGNSLVLCHFANVAPETTLGLVNAALGASFSLEELARAGERGWNLKRAINHRLGLNASHDNLPESLLKPFPDGGAAGYIPDFKSMLQAYYLARGWDPRTGKPRRETLISLGLDWIASELWPQS